MALFNEIMLRAITLASSTSIIMNQDDGKHNVRYTNLDYTITDDSLSVQLR